MPESYSTGYINSHPEIALMLGHFVSRWSLAESTLIMPLMMALQSTEQGPIAAILASSNSAEAKINLTRTAIKNSELSSDTIDKIDKAIIEFFKLCPQRNKLFHHVWLTEIETDQTVSAQPGAGI